MSICRGRDHEVRQLSEETPFRESEGVFAHHTRCSIKRKWPAFNSSVLWFVRTRETRSYRIWWRGISNVYSLVS